MPSTAAPRRRLSPEARAEAILDAAVAFFADRGFGAETRALAAQAGVSQALIFRYFGTKDALVERVYARVFLARWDPAWRSLLTDRTRPLEARLRAFYRAYLAAVDDRHWIRIAMQASLSGSPLTRRYVRGPVTDLLRVIARELRHEGATPATATVELERAWHLHSGVIYFLIRKHIHQLPVPRGHAALVDGLVGAFLRGVAPTATPPALIPPPGPSPARRCAPSPGP